MEGLINQGTDYGVWRWLKITILSLFYLGSTICHFVPATALHFMTLG